MPRPHVPSLRCRHPDEDAPARQPHAALAVLDEASEALAGFTCDASTTCCRFGVTGREPWLTQAEWRLLEREVRRQGRKLPVVDDAASDEDQPCPFLSSDGRCRVYAVRPLGCRTFFCERAQGPGPLPRRALAGLPQRLEALTEAVGDGDPRARPLRSWLRAARRAR